MNILIPEQTKLKEIVINKYIKLQEIGNITISEYKMSNEEILKAVEEKKYNALMIDSASFVLKREFLISLRGKIKIISMNATGYNNIDVQTAKEEGIMVCNVPDYAGQSVAELVFSMIFSLLRKLKRVEDSLREANWRGKNLIGNELKGKTLGIIGFGHIGKTIEKIAKALDMNVLIHDVFVSNNDINFVSLKHLFSHSDIISLHVPLSDTTFNFISKDEFEKMKKGVIIINTARGNLIKEEDLYQAILNGKVAGAGIDVFSNEPIENEKDLKNPLFNKSISDRVILTPHIGFYTHEAIKHLYSTWCENVIMFAKKKPQNVVN